MPEVEVGKVTHYFDRIHVAVLRLKEPLQIGDEIRISGHSTELVQTVGSLQIDHKPVQQAGPGDDVALLVTGLVREHDKVYLVARAP